MGHCVAMDSVWKEAARPRSRATPGLARCQTKPVHIRQTLRRALGSGVLPGMNVIDVYPQTVHVAWRCELRNSPHEDANAESQSLKLRRDGSAYRMKTC